MFDDQPSLNPTDELKRILALTGGRANQPVGAPPITPPAPTNGGIVPAAPSAAAAIATPNAPPPIMSTPPQTQTDTNELNRLKNSPSGIDQFRQKHPIIGTIAKIGEIAGSSLFPGVAAQIPGTDLHHSQLLNQGQARVNQDIAGAEKQAQTAGQTATTAHTEAETGAIPAHTALEQAQTEAVENKPDASKTLQQSYADAVNAAVKAGRNPLEDPTVQQFADSITQLQKQPQQTQEKLDQQYSDAIKAGDHETAQRVLKVKHDLAVAGQAPQRPPQVTMIVPGANGEQTVQALHAGQAVPAGSRTPTQFGPTAQERNVSAQAQIAAEGIPTVIAEIDRLKNQLGPVSGRWNEFVQGKVGMDNPGLAGFRADLLMVSSAVALAHARGRLPENLREEFDRAINAPQQNPENLKAVLNHIQPWMQRMTNMSDTAGKPQPSGADTGTPPPAGAKVRDYTQLAH